MIKKLDEEKNLLYCLEEIRLLIERPHEQPALTERLSTIKDKLEEIYDFLLMLHKQVVFFSQDDPD